MFIILLRLSSNKARLGEFIDGHNAWIRRGFEDGVFLLTGTIKPKLGGGILAHDTTLAELEKRVGEDPFVAENVVTAEIIEIEPGRTEERLAFLGG
jgi:uncharacterized protein YciI